MFQNGTKLFVGTPRGPKGKCVSQGNLHVVPRQPPITSQGVLKGDTKCYPGTTLCCPNESTLSPFQDKPCLFRNHVPTTPHPRLVRQTPIYDGLHSHPIIMPTIVHLSHEGALACHPLPVPFWIQNGHRLPWSTSHLEPMITLYMSLKVAQSFRIFLVMGHSKWPIAGNF